MRLVTYYIQREVEFMIQQLMAMGLYAKSLKDATKEVSRYVRFLSYPVITAFLIRNFVSLATTSWGKLEPGETS